jgi:hypothetical protein
MTMMIEHGNTGARVAGTYTSYFDAERIRNALRQRQLPVTDVEIAALGVERHSPPRPAPSLPKAVAGRAAKVVLPCAATALVAAGLSLGSIVVATLVGFAVAVALATAALWGSDELKPSAAIEPTEWAVLIHDDQSAVVDGQRTTSAA